MLRTLTRKIIIGGVGLLICVALAAAVVTTNVQRIRTATDHLSQETVEQVGLAGQFNTDMLRAIAETDSYARTHDLADQEDALHELRDAGTILDQLGALSVISHPFDPQMRTDQMLLQQDRASVFAVLAPTIRKALNAAEANDTAALAQSLARLTTVEAGVERIEEQSGALADRSIATSTSAISTVIQQSILGAAGLFSVVALAVLGVVLYMRHAIVRPITRLARAAQTVTDRQLDQTIAITNTDEIGSLQQAFNQMVASLRHAGAAVAEQQILLEARVGERTADLTQALDELRETSSARDLLSAAIQELSSPVLPVLEGILVMPLIGLIDNERAGRLLRELLAAIERHRARSIILDVTGVPLIDTQVARVLLHAADAARLIGTQTIMVGIRPELAQTIVQLGVNLSDIVTRADLQSGVIYAIQQQPTQLVAGQEKQ
jgi:anti-anti-sigma factor